MSIVRFACLCDHCSRRSEEYAALPSCRHCLRDTCPDCSVDGATRETDGEHEGTTYCQCCLEEHGAEQELRRQAS